MHPVLFKIPLPAWSLPLGPTLFVLAGLGFLLALMARRRGALDLLVIGVLALVSGVVGGVLFRGQRYTLESLPIYSYGAMLCASIVVGWFLTLGLGARSGLSRELCANCYFVTALAALVGARLLYVLTNLHEFRDLWDVLALRRGGLVAYGGFLGGFVGSWWYLRRRGVSLLPWADVAVPSLASGLLLTRIGCYLFGCDFGKPLPTTAPAWLRRLGTFPRWPSDWLDGAGSPAWLQHVDQRGLSVSAQTSLPVHPTELYESLAGALLLLMLWRLGRRRRFAGESFFAFTFGYGYLRFWLELWRDDLERGSFGPALPQQLLMPALLSIFALAFAYGPARGIEQRWLRRAAIALGALLALLAYWLLRPAPNAASLRAALSTSQWISLLSALAVAIAWHRMRGAPRRGSPSVANTVAEAQPRPLSST